MNREYTEAKMHSVLKPKAPKCTQIDAHLSGRRKRLCTEWRAGWLPAGRGQVAGESLRSTNNSPQHAGVQEVVDKRRLEVGVAVSEQGEGQDGDSVV